MAAVGRAAAFAQGPASTPFAALFTPETRRRIERGLNYLVSQQNEDGSFSVSRNVAICGLAGMAMLANGSTPNRGPFGESLTAVVEFLLAACKPSGFIFSGDPTGREMYGHGFATLFLAEVFGMTQHPDLPAKLKRAVRLIVDSQNAEGGWRYTPRRLDADISVTVCQVMALRAAHNAGVHVPKKTLQDAIAYVKRCQNEDGGFSYRHGVGEQASDFARSAAAIVALYSAGIYESAEVERGLAYLLRHRPSDNTGRKPSYFLYGHYYAAQAMWHAGSPEWNEWYRGIRTVLSELQQENGAWYDDPGEEYGTAMSCLILQMPSNYLPIFRR